MQIDYRVDNVLAVKVRCLDGLLFSMIDSGGEFLRFQGTKF